MPIMDVLRRAPATGSLAPEPNPPHSNAHSVPWAALRSSGAGRALFLAAVIGCLVPAIECGTARADGANPVIGMYRIVRVVRGDTLHKIARRYDVNVRVLAALNQVRDGSLRPGQELTLPLLHVPPLVPEDGIVLNIPERQVYVIRRSVCVATFAVAVGQAEWRTPTGTYTVASRVVNPQWQPTKSMVERTLIRDEPVQPGPDNPIGDRWIGWSLKGFGFHSTTEPNSIGSASSHGCVRLFPEAARHLFEIVKKGDTIYSVYEPVVLGKRRGRYYLCVVTDIYNQGGDLLDRARSLLRKELPPGSVDMDEVAEIVRNHDGYPIPLGVARWSAAGKRSKVPAYRKRRAAT